MPAVGFVALYFFLSVGAVALFTFVGVSAWSGARTQERIALYRAELLKKIAEGPGEGGRQVLALLQHEERRREADRRHGMTLSGLVTAAVGVAFMVMMMNLGDESFHVWTIGLIPFLIGVVLVAFARLALRPRPALQLPDGGAEGGVGGGGLGGSVFPPAPGAGPGGLAG
jgi:peptidoglycan/LPS O-acetylase OafA/YrhL